MCCRPTNQNHSVCIVWQKFTRTMSSLHTWARGQEGPTWRGGEGCSYFACLRCQIIDRTSSRGRGLVTRMEITNNQSFFLTGKGGSTTQKGLLYPIYQQRSPSQTIFFAPTAVSLFLLSRKPIFKCQTIAVNRLVVEVHVDVRGCTVNTTLRSNKTG